MSCTCAYGGVSLCGFCAAGTRQAALERRVEKLEGLARELLDALAKLNRHTQETTAGDESQATPVRTPSR